jgi:hypothetical protein
MFSYIRSVFLVLLFHLSRFLFSLVAAVHSQSMCSVVSDTPQKGHSVLLVCTPYSVWIPSLVSFLLRLVESSFHFIFSFLNLMVFSPCDHLSFLFFASFFYIQLIRSCGAYSSRSLMSSSIAFFAASFPLSLPMIPEWLIGIHISLTLSVSWSSSSLIRLVFGFLSITYLQLPSLY